jgi:hypothetical protein
VDHFKKLLSLRLRKGILLLVERTMKRPREEVLREKHSKNQNVQVMHFPPGENNFFPLGVPSLEQEAAVRKEEQLPLLGSGKFYFLSTFSVSSFCILCPAFHLRKT